MARDWNKVATEIVDLVGGKDNIKSVTHCITRLRFVLVDDSIPDDKKVGQVEGVIQVMRVGAQYQVVIGNHVGDAYDAVIAMMPEKAAGEVDADDGEAAPAKFGIGALLDLVTGIFTPFLAGFTAAGMMKAVAVMLSSFGILDEASSTYIIINSIGDGLFQFLPIVLAFTAADKFHTNKWVSVAIAAFLCHPNMATLSATFAETGGPTFLGLPVIMPDSGYLQSVFPIILAVWLQSWVEKPIAKLPDTFRGLFGNMIVLFVTGTITLLVVGPVVNTISGWIASGLMWVLQVAPPVAGFLIAALWPVLIIFGMHWAFIPIVISNFGTLGYDFILPITVGTNYAVGACCLAILLKSKRQDIKETAGECLGSAWLGGITEPAIYGLLLKYKKPFAVMSLACGICGAYAAMFNMTQTALITTSVITLPAVYAMCGIHEIIAIAIAVVGAFVGTFLWGYNDKMAE